MILATRAEPKKVPVITRSAIIIIFQPCFANALISFPMEIPANAPTIVRGAVKLILLADSMTKEETGEIGQAAKSPNDGAVGYNRKL